MTDDDIAQITAIFRTVLREELGAELALRLPLRRLPHVEPVEPPLDALRALLDARAAALPRAAASVTAAEAAQALYGLDGEPYARDLMRAARVLRELGWQKYKGIVAGVRGWRYRPAKAPREGYPARKPR